MLKWNLSSNHHSVFKYILTELLYQVKILYLKNAKLYETERQKEGDDDGMHKFIRHYTDLQIIITHFCLPLSRHELKLQNKATWDWPISTRGGLHGLCWRGVVNSADRSLIGCPDAHSPPLPTSVRCPAVWSTVYLDKPSQNSVFKPQVWRQ